MRTARWRILLSGAGILNAVVYAALLPLWDGFDEPFHYSYVQQLSRRRELPVQGRATVSAEVQASLPLAPGSYLVKRNLPQVIAFDEYFARSLEQRAALRARLEALDPRSGAELSEAPNYEAHQPPLAYAILAAFDFAWRDAPLLTRVLRLRILCGSICAVSMTWLTFSIARRLGLTARWAAGAVYVVLSSQMLYASAAHVANDWLAIPLFAALVLAAMRLRSDPCRTTACIFAVVLAAGLLTKAYFLAALPFAACELRRVRSRDLLAPAAILACALPWYGRNLLLYHDLSGMQETARRGVPVAQMLRAAAHFPWARSADATLAHTLWTGNNSDTTLNATTIHLMLLLIGAGLASWLWRNRPADRPVVAAVASFSAGLLYSTLLSYTLTRAVQISPSPWYVQPLLAPTMCLCMAGLARSRRHGAVIRAAIVWLWAYVLCVTWVAKLLPLYGGYTGRTSFTALWHWYTASYDAISRTLALTAMIPLPPLCALIGASMLAALLIAATLALTSTAQSAPSPIVTFEAKRDCCGSSSRTA